MAGLKCIALRVLCQQQGHMSVINDRTEPARVHNSPSRVARVATNGTGSWKDQSGVAKTRICQTPMACTNISRRSRSRWRAAARTAVARAPRRRCAWQRAASPAAPAVARCGWLSGSRGHLETPESSHSRRVVFSLPVRCCCCVGFPRSCWLVVLDR